MPTRTSLQLKEVWLHLQGGEKGKQLQWEWVAAIKINQEVWKWGIELLNKNPRDEQNLSTAREWLYERKMKLKESSRMDHTEAKIKKIWKRGYGTRWVNLEIPIFICWVLKMEDREDLWGAIFEECCLGVFQEKRERPEALGEKKKKNNKPHKVLSRIHVFKNPYFDTF